MTTPYPNGLSLDIDSADDAAMVQLLGPDGKRRDHSFFGPLADELTAEQLLEMYRHMVRTRAFDAEATALQRKGELGLWAPTVGQEGIQVGAATAFRRSDMIFPSYREHAVASMRGLPLRELLPVMRGVRHGGWNPAEHNFHLQTFVIGAHTLHAVGYAMALQRNGEVGQENDAANRAVVVFHGDGATSQGDVNEALIFAASAKSPVVFICQNNQWAISVPTSTQSRTALVRRAPGFGVPAVRVDGNDPLASYAVTHEALRRSRAGEGPMFIEAVTYRMGAHTTSDDPTRYRTREEEATWRERDPITRLRTYLQATNVLDDDAEAAIDQEAETLTREIREYCLSLEGGQPADMFDHAYAAPHPLVDAEREELLAFESQFDDGAEHTSGQEAR